MASKTKSALSTELSALITSQTNPESISPIEVALMLQDIIDSMYDIIDDALTPGPIDMTKAQLATAIGASTLNDKQWIRITNRADGLKLFVQCQGVNNISPFGIWVTAAPIPLAVIMNYVGGFEGETSPFIAIFDASRNFILGQGLTVETVIKIKGGTPAVNKVLVSDATGVGSWQLAAKYQGGLVSPAAIPNGPSKMLGLAGAITPGKSGNVLIIINGEYVSGTTTVDTIFVIRTGTGAAPANGDAPVGTAQQTNTRVATHATNRNPVSLSVIVAGLTPGTPYWIDMGVANNGAGSTQLWNVTISAFEQ